MKDQPQVGDVVPPTHACIHPVILCGGSGTRLWPLSRAMYPKQLLALMSERTMLQETVARVPAEEGFAAPMIVCNEEHRFLVADQLRDLPASPAAILLEPAARNTAPAIAVAALKVAAADPDAAMLVLPSDHHIGNVKSFHRAVRKGVEAARQGRLVTFGIAPTRPETGYGYIHRGTGVDQAEGAFAVDQFVEKPDAATARRYVLSGDFLWNSGIFLFTARRYLDELERVAPGVLETCRRALDGAQEGDGFVHLEPAAFAAAPNESIDRLVMERTQDAAVVPVSMEWNDIGSWRSLRDASKPDENGNVLDGDVLTEDVSNCYIRANGHLITAIGVENLIVVATEDALLIVNADRSGDVGRMVERLRQRNRPEPFHHTRVFRPWGSYETVDAGDRFQVKRIVVNPGAQLSLQKHHHRAEHWVVVAGTAAVTRDDETRLLRENESIYIPLGAKHRLENPGRLPLHVIEVQSGAYLGEDDIVRFDDIYGRG